MMQQTSLNVYREQVMPTLSKRQQLVITAIMRKYKATNMEVAEYLGWSINRVTPRVLELRKKGMVVNVGSRPCKVTGNLACCWKVI